MKALTLLLALDVRPGAVTAIMTTDERRFTLEKLLRIPREKQLSKLMIRRKPRREGTASTPVSVKRASDRSSLPRKQVKPLASSWAAKVAGMEKCREAPWRAESGDGGDGTAGREAPLEVPTWARS